MKKVLWLVAFLMPILLFAQKAPKEDKTMLIILHPTSGNVRAFEQAVAQHVSKFHKDQGQVDVYETLTGDRTGEYHFVYRNPQSWAGIQALSEAANGKEHSDDWTQNVAKYLSDPGSRYIYEASDDSYFPPNPADMFTNLMGVYLININPGMEQEFFAGIKKIKEMYKKNHSKNYYAIQSSDFGKGSQVAVIFPLPKGWSSFEPDPNSEWPKMFKTAFPKEDFNAWMKKFNGTQKSFESMVLQHRQDLSSPM